MGSDFYTWVASESSQPWSDEELHAFRMRIMGFVAPWFDVTADVHDSEGGPERGHRGAEIRITQASLPRLEELATESRRVRALNSLYKPSSTERVASARVPATWIEEEKGWHDNTLPTHLRRSLINANFYWDPTHFCNAMWFASDWALLTYRHFIDAAIDVLGAVRVVDGDLSVQPPPRTGGPSWRAELWARFLYYRNPRDFARSFLSGWGLEGDPDRVVAALRRLATEDYVTNELHQQRPDVQQQETGSARYHPFRRLRFRENGGIVLESRRLGVGPNGPSAGNPNAILQDALLREGVVKRGSTK